MVTGIDPGLHRGAQRGFTYLWVLFAVALLGVGLAAVSDVWVGSGRRQQREQFDWVGEQFVLAIASYYHAGPGGIKTFPNGFDELLDDRRAAVPRKHLRKVYLNPFTASVDWELLKGPDGRMRGVRGVLMTNGGLVTQDFTYAPRPPD